ncbi:MAG: aspartate/glutamate racemase family protein [Rhodospirillaceae bacterium]|nr:aspartate/glutamate racemase family protein [Rhodospirillaceae bacterium]
MRESIVVINPNSTEACTDAIDMAMQPLRLDGGPAIECVTMNEGPPGIESQHDSDSIILPLCDYIRARDNDAGAFVIACFSDPGLHAARERTDHPVLGIAEAAYLTAMTKGEKFGVISILEPSVKRHGRYVRQMGIESRSAGDRAIGLGVVELAQEDKVLDRMIETGKALRDEDGADVLILGCAGMARYRNQVSDAVGLPVVEPSQSAVAMAMGQLRCG